RGRSPPDRGRVPATPSLDLDARPVGPRRDGLGDLAELRGVDRPEAHTVPGAEEDGIGRSRVVEPEGRPPEHPEPARALDGVDGGLAAAHPDTPRRGLRPWSIEPGNGQRGGLPR